MRSNLQHEVKPPSSTENQKQHVSLQAPKNRRAWLEILPVIRKAQLGTGTSYHYFLVFPTIFRGRPTGPGRLQEEQYHEDPQPQDDLEKRNRFRKWSYEKMIH